MTPERYQKITQVLAMRQPDLTVVTDEVHKGRNISAIVRTCDAVGVDQVHCVTPIDGFQTYGGTSASAEKWVNLVHYPRVEEPLVKLKAQGFQLIAANLSAKAIDYRNVDYTRPTALVLGAEIKGVSAEACLHVDAEVVVPMVGMVESFNVSVACALILMEAQGQRERAGMYQQCRLSEAVYKKRFMHWAHPIIAEYCDKHGLEYPEVREDGEIIELSSWYKNSREHTR
ncbi:tRNA (guanosine-2'-O-)-methyltransferase [Alteromonadaceae bacterium Bs31]|nr:tRNA (guanosine-2'-O-)-methyltransferase [Alteromonadaceae bacterium Bs31]